MPVYDNVLFPSGSGGGSSVKIYTAGMTAAYGDVIRSGKNALPFVRFSKTPETYTVNADPADLPNHFMFDDATSQLGDIRSFVDNLPYESDGLLKKNGQVWLRTGNIVPASIGLLRPIGDDLKMIGDYWTITETNNSTVGLAGTINHAVGDGHGNWLAVNTSGNIYKSVDDGDSWTYVAATSTAKRLATNKNGRWWYCATDGRVFVSDNFGTSWTQQITPQASAPAVFAFMCGKLVYASTSGVNSTGTAGQTSSFAKWLPDTNSTSQAWTNYSFDFAVTANTSLSGTFTPWDACTNDVDTIWFGGLSNASKAVTFVLNTSTNTWYATQGTGNVNYFFGMAFDSISNSAFVLGGYWYSSSAAAQISEYAVTAVGKLSSLNLLDTWIPSSVFSGGFNTVNSGTGYIRRGGSGFLLFSAYGASNQALFKYSGSYSSSPATYARIPSRKPYSDFRTGSTPMGIAVAGDTAIIFGTGYCKTIASVGIAPARSVAPGQTDFVRIQ